MYRPRSRTLPCWLSQLTITYPAKYKLRNYVLLSLLLQLNFLHDFWHWHLMPIVFPRNSMEFQLQCQNAWSCWKIGIASFTMSLQIYPYDFSWQQYPQFYFCRSITYISLWRLPEIGPLYDITLVRNRNMRGRHQINSSRSVFPYALYYFRWSMLIPSVQ